jgi:hypothetical protein
MRRRGARLALGRGRRQPRERLRRLAGAGRSLAPAGSVDARARRAGRAAARPRGGRFLLALRGARRCAARSRSLRGGFAFALARSRTSAAREERVLAWEAGGPALSVRASPAGSSSRARRSRSIRRRRLALALARRPSGGATRRGSRLCAESAVRGRARRGAAGTTRAAGRVWTRDALGGWRAHGPCRPGSGGTPGVEPRGSARLAGGGLRRVVRRDRLEEAAGVARCSVGR